MAMRWSLGGMLFIVLIVALALATFKLFQNEGYRDITIIAIFALTVNLAATTTATAALAYAEPKWKRFWLAYTLFGWSYFVFVLRAGFLITPLSASGRLSEVLPYSALGIVLCLVCALTAQKLPGTEESPVK
jgi:hypothetical protein